MALAEAGVGMDAEAGELPECTSVVPTLFLNLTFPDY